MRLHVKNHIRNVKLSPSPIKALLPLIEAIINSIQAIEDSGESKGNIEITILRDGCDSLNDRDGAVALGNIIGFEVSDNGIGFTDNNYEAFETADTPNKLNRGCKGVGRFLWLVAFNGVEIESHFRKDETMWLRRFHFVPEGDGIKDMTCESSTRADCMTTVRLSGFKAIYQKPCPKKIETIAAHIVQHCLTFFLRKQCPKIILADRQSGDTIDLNRLFDTEMGAKSQTKDFAVKEHKFYVVHVRLYSSHVKEHYVHFCANDYVVKSEKLRGRIPDLGRTLEDDHHCDFRYAAYVQSEFLDSVANPTRTAFDISDEATDLLPDEMTWKEINSAVEEQCRSFVDPYTQPVAKQKEERINRFVATEAPMYRPIMKHIGKKIEKIDPEVSDDELDVRLYEAYHALQVELHTEGQSLLKRESAAADDIDEYSARLEAYFSRVTDINAADLARYVCHRKTVLEFLHKQLAVKDDGKYRREERIHSIIFPMRKTSEDVPFDGHNLWLIDEKLSYHAFLASDKALRSIPQANCTSGKEPDIIVYDVACAFVSSAEPPYPAIVIIEFKKPMRDDYKEDKNPLIQVREYITELQTKKARTPDGRDVPIDNNTPFYCYVVCDIGPTLVQQAKDFELLETPDGQGFFGFKRHYNAYFEIISYTKMESDAKKRNAILFDKLALPSRINLKDKAAIRQTPPEEGSHD